MNELPTCSPFLIEGVRIIRAEAMRFGVGVSWDEKGMMG